MVMIAKDKTNKYGILAPNRDVLLKELEKFRKYKNIKLLPDGVYLSVQLDCGTIKEYKTINDIPDKTDSCSCGCKKYFIEYER